jgi:GT2 family glycosyltransferase
MVEDLWMVIPTATRRDYIPDIIKESGIDKDKIVIVHTKNDNEPYYEVNNIYDTGEINIQRWWNKGIDFVTSKGGRYVAILNDDVRLAGNPLNTIATVMKETGAALGYPYPFQGWVCGYCFIIDLATDVRPDERYRWWYGDRDLDLQARKQGGAVHVPAMVRHIEGNILTTQNKELQELAKIDEYLFFEKWTIPKSN